MYKKKPFYHLKIVALKLQFQCLLDQCSLRELYSLL